MTWIDILKYDEGLHERQYDSHEADWEPLMKQIEHALQMGIDDNKDNTSRLEDFEEALEFCDDIRVLLEGE